MKVIDIQTTFFPTLEAQVTLTICETDNGRYKVTVKVADDEGDTEHSCEWRSLSLAYDWAVGLMMREYGVGV